MENMASHLLTLWAVGEAAQGVGSVARGTVVFEGNVVVVAFFGPRDVANGSQDDGTRWSGCIWMRSVERIPLFSSEFRSPVWRNGLVGVVIGMMLALCEDAE